MRPPECLYISKSIKVDPANLKGQSQVQKARWEWLILVLLHVNDVTVAMLVELLNSFICL